MTGQLGPADVLAEAVANSLRVCGPKQAQLIREMLQACAADFVPLIAHGDRPGMFLPARVGLNDGKMHAGGVLTVEGRLIVCWFEGLLRRTHSTVVPLDTNVSVTQAKQANGLSTLTVRTPSIGLLLVFMDRGGVDSIRALLKGTGSTAHA